jgi:uncharacterized repeat protein (TIGR03803 family)
MTMPAFDATAGAIYQFKGGNYGANPAGGLINVGGTFYGTTFGGGGAAACSGGCGTVYAVSPSGAERVVYTFQGGSDGARPRGNLINVAGTLYGTTGEGGFANPNCVTAPAARYSP